MRDSAVGSCRLPERRWFGACLADCRKDCRLDFRENVLPVRLPFGACLADCRKDGGSDVVRLGKTVV